MASRSLEKVIDSYSCIVGIIRLSGLKYQLNFNKDDDSKAESLYIYLFDKNDQRIEYKGLPTITIASDGKIKLRSNKNNCDILNQKLGIDSIIQSDTKQWKTDTYCCAFYGNSDNFIKGFAFLFLVETFL